MLPSPQFFLSHSLSFLIHALFSLVFFPRISPLPEFSNPTNFAAPSNPTIASRFFHVTVIADCCRFQVKHVFFFFSNFLLSVIRFSLEYFYSSCIVSSSSRRDSGKRENDRQIYQDEKISSFSFRMEERRHVTRNLLQLFPYFHFLGINCA